MPKRLQGVSDIDLRIKPLGHDLPFPMITVPMGAQGMIHVDAELASAGGTGMAEQAPEQTLSGSRNYGDRQIDGVPASISMLRAAVDAVEGRAPVILDGGVRRGIDVFKALAVGRPVLWASAVGGAPGVGSVYAHVTGEMKSAMLLSGVAKVAKLGASTSFWRRHKYACREAAQSRSAPPPSAFFSSNVLAW
jgi:isopentenyl diphosphate isomerase/L-lactate dehydrogenase-like FMN-dependent dehydrogenase